MIKRRKHTRQFCEPTLRIAPPIKRFARQMKDKSRISGHKIKGCTGELTPLRKRSAGPNTTHGGGTDVKTKRATFEPTGAATWQLVGLKQCGWNARRLREEGGTQTTRSRTYNGNRFHLRAFSKA